MIVAQRACGYCPRPSRGSFGEAGLPGVVTSKAPGRGVGRGRVTGGRQRFASGVRGGPDGRTGGLAGRTARTHHKPRELHPRDQSSALKVRPRQVAGVVVERTCVLAVKGGVVRCSDGAEWDSVSGARAEICAGGALTSKPMCSGPSDLYCGVHPYTGSTSPARVWC